MEQHHEQFGDNVGRGRDVGRNRQVQRSHSITSFLRMRREREHLEQEQEQQEVAGDGIDGNGRRTRTDTTNRSRAALLMPSMLNLMVSSVSSSREPIRWNLVEHRIIQYPAEVRVLDTHGNAVLYNALNQRRRSRTAVSATASTTISARPVFASYTNDSYRRYPPTNVIQRLIRAYPEAVWIGTRIMDHTNEIRFDSKQQGEKSLRKMWRMQDVQGSRVETNYNIHDVYGSYDEEYYDHYTSQCPLYVACCCRASCEILLALMQERPSIPSLDRYSLFALWNSYRTNVFGHYEDNNNSNNDDDSDEELVRFLTDQSTPDLEASRIIVRLYHVLEYCTNPKYQLSLDAFPRNDNSKDDSDRVTTPLLHAMVSTHKPCCDSNLLRHMIHLFPDQLRQRRRNGELPLHTFLRNNNESTWCGTRKCRQTDVQRTERSNNNNNNNTESQEERDARYECLRLLVASYPVACQLRCYGSFLDSFDDSPSRSCGTGCNGNDEIECLGQLPLHIAIQNCGRVSAFWDGDAFDLLLGAYPYAISESSCPCCCYCCCCCYAASDSEASLSLYPFQLAAMHDLPISIIYKLLRKDPRVLVYSSSAHNCKDLAHMFTLKRTRIRFDDPARPLDHNIVVTIQNTSGVCNDRQQLRMAIEYFGGLRHENRWKSFRDMLFGCSRRSYSAMDYRWYATHAAASLPMCPVGILKVFVSQTPSEMYQVDHNGWNALHHAASTGHAEYKYMKEQQEQNDGYGGDIDTDHEDETNESDASACVGRVSVLIRADATDATMPFATRIGIGALARTVDNKGRLPLHIAALTCLPVKGLIMLYEAWPDALMRRDGQDGLYPALHAASVACDDDGNPATPYSLDAIYHLLLANPQVLFCKDKSVANQSTSS